MVALGVAAQAQTPKPMSEGQMRAAGGRQLTAAELREKLAGSTAHLLFLKRLGQGSEGMVARVYFRHDRRRAVGGGRGQKHETIWWFEGDDLCGEERLKPGNVCYRHFELAGTIYV